MRDAGRQIALIASAVLGSELARRLSAGDLEQGRANAARVWGLERSLGIAVEPRVQEAVAHVPGALLAASAFYVVAHLAVTGLVLAWLYRRARDEYAVLRNTLLWATGIALLLQWRLPTAPPRLAGVGAADTVRAQLHLDVGAVTNAVAAFPSLHAGYAVGVGIAVWRAFPGARALAVAYPGVVVLAIVATGNHFLLDAVAGAAVVLVGLALQSKGVWLYSDLRRGVEQPGSSPGS